MTYAGPHDVDAERALLGAILYGGLDPLDAARATGLRPSMFYHPVHAAIWRACCLLADRNEPVDPTTVLSSCPPEKRPTVAPLLAEIGAESVLPATAAHYARIIRDAATLRSLAEAGLRINQRATSAPNDQARATLEASWAELDAVMTGVERDPLATFPDLIPPAIDRMEGGVATGLPSPWQDLNDLIGAMRPGQLIVLGARPSVGKTMIAVNMLAHVAGRLGKLAFMASCEMTRDELTDRFLAHVAQVDLSAIIQAQLSDDDWQRMARASRTLGEFPIEIDDASAQTTADIRGRMRQLARRDLAFVVVDYLQIVNATDPKLPREQQVNQIATDLKGLAKDFHVPILALAQLNRGPEQRRNKRPLMADLRESGAIENNADVVILLHREAAHEAELTVEKCRQGRTGKVPLVWQPYVMRALPRA